MKKRSKPRNRQAELREKLIGLGEDSLRKSYYPELQVQLDKLEERVRLAELSAEIGRALTEESDLRRSLQRCSDTLAAYTDAALVRIWTLDPEGEHLLLQASSGLHTAIDGAHSRLDLQRYPHKVGIIARDRHPFLTNEVAGHPQFHDQAWVREHAIVAFAGYPLVLQQRLVGVIALFAQHPLSETLLKTLENINDQLAVSIDRFQLLEAYKSALANAREGHEKINGILRSVADALLVIDNRQHLVHMNQAAEALLGVSLATAVDRRIDEVIRPSALLDYLRTIRRSGQTEHDTDLDLYDAARGEMRVIQARAAHLKGATPGGGRVISLRDVTQDREVARMKSEFISTAAHELRTPLTSICGFAELLCSQSWSREEQDDFLHTILDKAATLEQIIDDLLDLGRIESGRGLSLSFSEWDVAETLDKMIARYRTEYADYRFECAVDRNLGTIHADQGKIMQALDNLLNNAIKYSPPGKPIVLGARRDDQTLTISVSDRGIGMNAEQRRNCFDKFYRADSSNTAVGGLGLGLSIVRHVIEAHHGEIRVDSHPGRGTTMTVTLPLLHEGCNGTRDDKIYLADLFRQPPTRH